MDQSQKLLYDRKSAAFALSVSVRSVDYALANGEFETRRIGRKVLIIAASLKKYAASNHFGPVSKARRESVSIAIDEDERRAA